MHFMISMLYIFRPLCTLFIWSLVNSTFRLVSDLLFSFEMFAGVKGDVYPIEPSDSFTVNQVLDAQWGFLNDEDVRSLNVSFLCFVVMHCNPHMQVLAVFFFLMFPF